MLVPVGVTAGVQNELEHSKIIRSPLNNPKLSHFHWQVQGSLFFTSWNMPMPAPWGRAFSLYVAAGGAPSLHCRVSQKPRMSFQHGTFLCTTDPAPVPWGAAGPSCFMCQGGLFNGREVCPGSGGLPWPFKRLKSFRDVSVQMTMTPSNLVPSAGLRLGA